MPSWSTTEETRVQEMTYRQGSEGLEPLRPGEPEREDERESQGELIGHLDNGHQ